MLPSGGNRAQDGIARALATGEISRRSALKRLAAGALGAAIPTGVFASSSLGACPESRRCPGGCCPKHSKCHRGKCRCDRDYTKCAGRCFDLKASRKHCGACGNTCAEGERCADGACVECVTDSECGVGYYCSAGSCVYGCTTNTQCVSPNTCINNHCGCTDSSTCYGGICDEGICRSCETSEECAADPAYGAGYVCNDGACTYE